MIFLEMGAAPNGVDPRVTIDGVDVTDRVASIELLPLGIAVAHMFAEPQEFDFDSSGQRFHRLKRQIVQQEYRMVNP